MHYSHDAWEVVPTVDVIALMRKAGLRQALVSSSDDEGTQRLHAAAPDLIVPGLRPYRKRGEISTWMRDDSIVRHLEQRLAKHRYATIGEFHLYGADADLPVPRRMVELARRHGLILHAHTDADALERLFRQDPQARVLWAHAGFEPPSKVREMLRRHRNLHADLAFRSDMGGAGRVDPEWAEAFTEFPDRFMVGTDTFTPERLHYIPAHAEFSREWLQMLPRTTAERIAWQNAEAFVGAAWKANRDRPLASGEADGSADCAAAAAEPGARRVDDARHTLVYRPVPQTVAVGAPFSVRVTVCAKSQDAPAESLAVDALMPEHRHGMNYSPRITRVGTQRFDADGMLFHMPGHWRLVFDVRSAGVTGRMFDDLQVR